MNVTGTGIAVALAVAIALAFLLFGASVFRPFSTPQATENAFNQPTATNTTNPSTMQAPLISEDALPTELTVTDVTVGTGAEAKVGDTVSVNYVGALPNGQVFDASANHGGPFTFTLGEGRVIAGWDQGLVGMKEGGTRQLIIPPDMGYGSQGAGDVIPPNATLLFQVELVKVGQ